MVHYHIVYMRPSTACQQIDFFPATFSRTIKKSPSFHFSCTSSITQGLPPLSLFFCACFWLAQMPNWANINCSFVDFCWKTTDWWTFLVFRLMNSCESVMTTKMMMTRRRWRRTMTTERVYWTEKETSGIIIHPPSPRLPSKIYPIPHYNNNNF